MESNFIDYVKFYAKSGDGGAGSVHFRREKHVPKGGPDGGDGGHGGNIILRGNSQLWTLLHLKYRKHITAANGGHGEGNRKFGKDGEDIVLEVPIGTIAKDSETGEKLLEIMEDGEEKVLLPGGKGGLGNVHYKSSTNQTPRYAQPGIEGKEAWIILELKILADVGLVGFPNAGKSTLLSVVSEAKPEIADYPFTTLVPNLGVVPYRDYKSFVMADIPGLIEGASQGKGLGHQFLKHIERNKILLFLIDILDDNPQDTFNKLKKELHTFNDTLMDKPTLVVRTKLDTIQNPETLDQWNGFSEEYIDISSVSNSGLDNLKDRLVSFLSSSL